MKEYQIKRKTSPVRIDGNLEKDVWIKAEKSPRFIDAVGGTPGVYDTTDFCN